MKEKNEWIKKEKKKKERMKERKKKRNWPDKHVDALGSLCALWYPRNAWRVWCRRGILGPSTSTAKPHVQWNMETCKCPCAFDNNGRFLALLSSDGRLKVWDCTNGSLKHQYTPSSHLSTTCTCLRWSNSSRGSVSHCAIRSPRWFKDSLWYSHRNPFLRLLKLHSRKRSVYFFV